MAIERVGVVGFGQMGSGIAQVCAMAGLDVVAREIDQQFIERGFSRIDSSLARVVKSGKVSEDDAKKTRGRIRGTTALADFKDRDLVMPRRNGRTGSRDCTSSIRRWSCSSSRS